MDLSSSSLLASLLVSTLGMSLFLYGKKQVRPPQLVTGIVMMAFPYFVSGAVAVAGLTGALLLGLWVAVRSGL